MIKWLKDIGENEIKLVGGKALNLAKMKAAGINVPNAFVITSDAYDTYVGENKLNDVINDIIKADKSLKEKSKSIKVLFEIESVEKNLRTQIEREFSQLESKSVAVRSSATVEDLPGISFAGQYSSFLNVSKDQVCQKVLECWQSLWHERAIDYRERNHIDTDFSHCVLVQEMIEAESSGVIFTANPISGMRSEIVINAAYGLGEGIVSGSVNPDQYIIDKNTKTIKEKKIMKKEEEAVYSEKGIDFIKLSEDKIEKETLSENQVALLIKACVEIESYYGKPQDIEFSFDKKGDLFILQSREITTLFPIENLDLDDKLRPYLVASTVLLAMKEPFTPLGADIYGGMFPKVLTVMTGRKKPVPDSFVKYEGGRLLLDVSYMMSSKFVAKQFANAFSGNDLPLKAVFSKLLEDHGYQMTHQGIRFKIPFGGIKYAFSFISKMRVAGKVAPHMKYNAVKEIGKEFIESRKKLIANIETIDEAYDFCNETMLEVFKLTQAQALYCTEVGQYASIEKTIKKNFGETFNLDVLGYALPECYTVEMALEMNAIAKELVEKEEKVHVTYPRIKSFIDLYGVRAEVELDAGYRRWHEDPSFILNQIESFMEDGLYERNIANHQAKVKEAAKMIEDIHSAFVETKGQKYADKFRDKLITYRRAAGMREYPKFNIVQAIDMIRTVLLNQGAKMVEKGYINLAEDIFYLNKNQILQTEDVRDLVQVSKGIYEKEMRRNAIPRIVLNTGETYYSAFKFDKNAKVLNALPLSSGVYEGRIRVVHSPSNSDLKEGEIMVAESTNPTWTPLFMKAKGLILEYGGPLSHGGIVAREYGIPAVVGITSVTDILRTGQLVRVDGESGIVEIIEE